MADHPLFSVSVVTPEGAAFDGDAEMLIVPGAAGEIGVLARHAPLVALLKAGSTRVHTGDGQIQEFATGPGFFQVLEDRAIALVDDAVTADEIDTAAAQRQLEEAQAELERVESGDSTADRWQIEQRIRHAENMLRVSGAVGLTGEARGDQRFGHGRDARAVALRRDEQPAGGFARAERANVLVCDHEHARAGDLAREAERQRRLPGEIPLER